MISFSSYLALYRVDACLPVSLLLDVKINEKIGGILQAFDRLYVLGRRAEK